MSDFFIGLTFEDLDFVLQVSRLSEKKNKKIDLLKIRDKLFTVFPIHLLQIYFFSFVS